MHMHFCENQVIDSVISYYCALAERNTIPFHVQIDLPAQISVDETDFCLVLSNLLENALEASLKTAKFRQRIDIKLYRHASNLILIQIENAFDGKIQQKHGIFLSSKRNENGMEYFVPEIKKILISFDKISTESFKYIWSMFKAFQLQDAKELIFMFYPREKDDVEFVKDNFIKTLYQVSPAITPEIEKKIKIDFIDNRSISPVDVGGR